MESMYKRQLRITSLIKHGVEGKPLAFADQIYNGVFDTISREY